MNTKYQPTWKGIQPLLWAAVECYLGFVAQEYADPKNQCLEFALVWAQKASDLARVCPSDFWGKWPDTPVSSEDKKLLLDIVDPQHNEGDWFAQRLAESFQYPSSVGKCWAEHNIHSEEEFLLKHGILL